MDIRNLCSKFRPKLRNKTKGYVVLLLVVFVPLIMLGTKLALDLATLHNAQINLRQRGGATYRRCAKQAALAVAENWNPGKSLDHQKRAVLKIADKVYNDNPPYDASNELSKAVPGIQIMTKDQVVIGKGFDPIIVTTKNIPVEVGQIPYKSETRYRTYRYLRVPSGWNPSFSAWRIVDKLTSLSTTYDIFDELDQTEYQSGKYVLNHIDRYMYPHQYSIKKYDGYPTRTAFSSGTQDIESYIWTSASSTSTSNESGYTESFVQSFSSGKNPNSYNWSPSSNGTYTCRTDENDNRVQIAVENDKIKVTTDSDVGYATPAECNVDIVLACPTNGAACNENNRDQNSTTSEMPSATSTSTDNATIKSCPIYQTGQAFRVFAKEFYHTKGVTMGLIPYSGKVSLDPNSEVAVRGIKKQNRGGTQRYCDSSGEYFRTRHYNPPDGSAGQNACQAYLRSYGLYDSYGLTDKELNAEYEWGTLLTGCPIRCRSGNTVQDPTNKNGMNYVFHGNILTNVDPLSTEPAWPFTVRFYQMNSNPCYGGYANLLTMRCERNCTVYLPNPYYIIEPTADVQKIYEICGALYPFYDEYNVSNFLFIPITWANNLWQSWTRNPRCNATNTDASGNGGQLEIPSKMTAGRKKVLILVINKPDWFEPHELTYLGFDNDFSELCMIESDRIDFSQDYGDTSKKFADGSPYDGTIQGPKKILKYTGPTTDTGTAKLTFPKRYLVKIVVEPGADDIKWEKKTQSSVGSDNYMPNKCTLGVGPVQGVGTRMVMNCWNGGLYYTNDGTNWGRVNPNGYSGTNWDMGMIYGNGVWVRLNNRVRDDGIQYTNNLNGGTALSTAANNAEITSEWAMNFGNGVFMLLSGYGVYTSTNGVNWTKAGSGPGLGSLLCYGNGKWIAGGGKVYESRDNGQTWKEISAGVGGGGAFARGHFFAVSGTNINRSKDGVSWTSQDLGCDGGHFNVTFYNGKLYVYPRNVGCCHIGTFSDGTITFTNLSATGATSGNTVYPVTGKREFFIEPIQIGGEDGNYHIDLSLKNVRLISAEITNRPYTTKPAYYSLSGNTIWTNVKRAMTLKVTPTAPYGSVTFYDNNKIEDNVGTHTITETKSFTFSGGQDPSGSSINTALTSSRGKNFGHNLSKYKVRFGLNDAKIIAASLNNQYVRDYIGQYGRYNSGYKTLILSDGTLAVRGGNGIYGICSTFYSTELGLTRLSEFPNGRENLAKFRDNCLVLGPVDWKVSNQYYWGNEYGETRSPEDLYWTTYGLSGTLTVFVRGNGEIFVQNISQGSIDGWKAISGISASNKISVASDGGIIMQFYVKSSTTKSLYSTSVYTTSLNQSGYLNSYVTLERLSSNLSNQIVAGDYICFQGDGDLSVTIQPTGKRGTLTHTKPDGSSVTETYAGNPTTITIDPDNYKYEVDGNQYKITLGTNGVALSDLQMVDQSNIYSDWDKIRMPEMSRYIDYSSNPYSAFMCTNSEVTAGWQHNGEFYVNKNNNGYYSGLVYKDYAYTGDHFALTYSDNLYTIVDHCRDGWADYSGRKTKQYQASGLSKVFTAFNMFEPYCLNNKKAINDYNGGAAGSISLIMQTMTLPINTALYCAYGRLSDSWYPTTSTNKFGIIPDASAAAQNVTKDACTKLKNDFGNDLRIYLIKYRKQTEYKHKVTGASTEYKYDYLDDCTTYKYDIDSEDDLKTTMKTISSDIKTWAGRTPARNVE